MFFDIVAGTGYGFEKILAFDSALLNAGIGNFNLIRLSSIIPAGFRKGKFSEIRDFYPPGALLHLAYSVAYVFPEDPFDFAVAGIGIGIGAKFGVVMEYTGHDKDEVDEVLKELVHKAFESRKMILKDEHYRTIAVPKAAGLVGCAFVGVPLWGKGLSTYHVFNSHR